MNESRETRGNLPPADTSPQDGQIDRGDLERLGEEGGAIGLRVGRNPANLGDEVPESGDVTYPPPVNETPEL